MLYTRLKDAIKRIWRNLKVTSKLTLLTSILVMVAVYSISYFNIKREEDSFRQALETQAHVLLDTIPLTIRDQLYYLELDELKDISSSIIKNEEITQFVIFDRNGAVLVDASQAELGYLQTIDPLGEEIINLSDRDFYIEWQTEQLLAGKAIFIGKSRVGGVVLGLSTQPLQQQKETLTNQAVFLTVLALLFGGMLTYLLSIQITNPLDVLTEQAARMAGGEESLRVDFKSQDEIGQLGQAFNQMAQAIHSREAELRKLTTQLEHTVEERTAELRGQNKKLEEMAITDSLTKLFNRRHFFQLAESEFNRAERYQHPLSIILLDADNFKTVNDTFGHIVGDQVLEHLARLCEQNIRNVDILARYGGEEFVILMPEADCFGAYQIAERLRRLAKDSPLVSLALTVPITISLGISCWNSDDDFGIDGLLARADIALYQAKENGRDKIVVWQPEH